MTLAHVVLVPQPGATYAITRAVLAEPIGAGSVQRPLPGVAQQRDGVPLYDTAKAARAGLVVDRKPEERHPADNLADAALKLSFARPNRTRCCAALPPGWENQSFTFYQRATH
ncbi:MAG: hypothetical protein U0821_18020 [Chloroflexota bacterium]